VSETKSAAGAQKRSLDNIVILMEAPPEVLAGIVEQCKWHQFGENDVVVESNDPSTDVYFVVRGRLRAMDFINEKEVALAEIGPGESFGELSAIDLKVRSARITALEPAVLASLSSREFRKLLVDCPGIALALLKRLAGFIRSLNTRVAAMSSMSPHQRIYFELLRLCEPNTHRDGTWIINNAPNHGELAAWVGAEREAVAEAIGNLARDGIVERRHKSLIIRHHERLKRLAGQ